MRVFDRLGARSVDTHTRERPAPSVPELVPDAGARFGRPSAFSYSLQRQQEEGGAVEDRSDDGLMHVGITWPLDEPPEYKRIIEADVKIYSKVVRITEGDDPEAAPYVEADRIQRMMFYFTEFPPKPFSAGFQPSFTTYFDLHFDLHPVERETEIT